MGVIGKVYCKNCKYFNNKVRVIESQHFILLPPVCEKYSKRTPDYILGGYNIERAFCKAMNNNGDCTGYKPKD